MPSEDFCPDCTWFSITVRLNPMLLTKFTQVFLLVFSKVDEIYCCFLKKKKSSFCFDKEINVCWREQSGLCK